MLFLRKDDMLKAIKLVNNNNGEFDIANVTVRSKGAVFNLGKDDSFNVKYGLLILNGNGCSFKLIWIFIYLSLPKFQL